MTEAEIERLILAVFAEKAEEVRATREERIRATLSRREPGFDRCGLLTRVFGAVEPTKEEERLLERVRKRLAREGLIIYGSGGWKSRDHLKMESQINGARDRWGGWKRHLRALERQAAEAVCAGGDDWQAVASAVRVQYLAAKKKGYEAFAQTGAPSELEILVLLTQEKESA